MYPEGSSPLRDEGQGAGEEGNEWHVGQTGRALSAVDVTVATAACGLRCPSGRPLRGMWAVLRGSSGEPPVSLGTLSSALLPLVLHINQITCSVI